MDDSGGGRRGSKYPLNEYVNTRSGEQALASSRKLVGRVICARRVPYPKEIWTHLDTGPSLLTAASFPSFRFNFSQPIFPPNPLRDSFTPSFVANANYFTRRVSTVDESERTLEDDGRFENRKKKNKEMVVDTLVGLRGRRKKKEKITGK